MPSFISHAMLNRYPRTGAGGFPTSHQVHMESQSSDVAIHAAMEQRLPSFCGSWEVPGKAPGKGLGKAPGQLLGSRPGKLLGSSWEASWETPAKRLGSLLGELLGKLGKLLGRAWEAPGKVLQRSWEAHGKAPWEALGWKLLGNLL